MFKCINGFTKLSFVRIKHTEEELERYSNHPFTVYSMLDFVTNKDVFNNLRHSALFLIVEGLSVFIFLTLRYIQRYIPNFHRMSLHNSKYLGETRKGWCSYLCVRISSKGEIHLRVLKSG